MLQRLLHKRRRKNEGASKIEKERERESKRERETGRLEEKKDKSRYVFHYGSADGGVENR